MIQKLFDAPVVVLDEGRDEVDAPSVDVMRDVEYRSRDGENTLDIFNPMDVEGSLPILFWMHGSYVGGNKEGVSEFAT